MLRLQQLEPLGLAPVSLELDDGACLCVSGPYGAGKTLLLRAIADLDRNEGDAATGSLVRSEVSAPDWRKAVAYVPAESGWWADTVGPHMSAGDIVPLLTALGLEAACIEWEVARLSTGERQRLALVRALLREPEILLLDEPTSALDEEATAAVERVIADRIQDGVTVVIVTHDTAQIERMGGQHAIVDQGRVELFSDGKTALSRP